MKPILIEEKHERMVNRSFRITKHHIKLLAKLSKKHKTNDSVILRRMIEIFYEEEFPQ